MVVLGLMVVVLDTVAVGVVVEIVLVVVGVSVFVAGVVVVGVTVVEGSGVVVVVVLAEVVVLGLTTTNKTDIWRHMLPRTITEVETSCKPFCLPNRQLLTPKHESGDICFFKLSSKLDLALCILLPVTQRRMSGPSSMLSGQAHVYLGEWSVI